MLRIFLFSFFLWVSVMGTSVVGTATAADVPRMASIGADVVNIRSGPGLDYPIQWVYQSKMLPIKIVAEYKNWFKFIDWENQEGWVFARLASNDKSFIVTADEAFLYFDADEDSQVIARIAKDKNGEVTHCGNGFCRVKLVDEVGNSYFGWMEEDAIWGGCTSEDGDGACAN